MSVVSQGLDDAGIIEIREFPRVLRPISDAVQAATVTGPFHRRLSDPVATAVAAAVFGKECISKVATMPNGGIMGTIEFWLVTEPGQPIDVDLDPPLARGDVIDIVLRAPKPGTKSRMGLRGPKRPVNTLVAVAKALPCYVPARRTGAQRIPCRRSLGMAQARKSERPALRQCRLLGGRPAKSAH